MFFPNTLVSEYWYLQLENGETEAKRAQVRSAEAAQLGRQPRVVV